MKKIKVPKKYYQEMVNELAASYYKAKTAPQMQLDRIKAVINSGQDYEVMTIGSTEHKIPLAKLMEYYIDAKKVDINEIKSKFTTFVSKHEWDESMKGDLKAANKEADEFCKSVPYYNDSDNNYNLLHDLSHKYFLCEEQMDRLMEFMMKKKYML